VSRRCRRSVAFVRRGKLMNAQRWRCDEIATAFTIEYYFRSANDVAESRRDNRAIDRARAKSPICDSVAVDSPLII